MEIGTAFCRGKRYLSDAHPLLNHLLAAGRRLHGDGAAASGLSPATGLLPTGTRESMPASGRNSSGPANEPGFVQRIFRSYPSLQCHRWKPDYPGPVDRAQSAGAPKAATSITGCPRRCRMAATPPDIHRGNVQLEPRANVMGPGAWNRISDPIRTAKLRNRLFSDSRLTSLTLLITPRSEPEYDNGKCRNLSAPGNDGRTISSLSFWIGSNQNVFRQGSASGVWRKAFGFATADKRLSLDLKNSL